MVDGHFAAAVVATVKDRVSRDFYAIARASQRSKAGSWVVALPNESNISTEGIFFQTTQQKGLEPQGIESFPESWFRGSWDWGMAGS